ncbi:MAG: SEC-C domain-containing protein [Pirellulales bacterium]|nr:SEC-C domain-containing protein [Pirellulales bacterium]
MLTKMSAGFLPRSRFERLRKAGCVEGLDLDDPVGILLAVERFVDHMETDLFRGWEAVIRREQGLPATPFLGELADDLTAGSRSRTLYIDDIARFQEPWYEILRKIAPRLLPETGVTADRPGVASLWSRVARAIDEHGHGLSLPEGVGAPRDVLPLDLQHGLWLYACLSWLSDTGQMVASGLPGDAGHERFSYFLGLLRGHRESVRFLGLTLDGLMDRLTLREEDQQSLVEVMYRRLELAGSSEPLAPRLEPLPPAAPVERLPEDRIKQAIVHPDALVREMGVLYFANSRSPDPAVAPLAIAAIQRYGWDAAFLHYGFLDGLVHGDESIQWMIKQLLSCDVAVHETRAGSDLLNALATADAAVLRRHERELSPLRRHSPGIYELLQDRIEIQRLNREQAWRQFQEAWRPMERAGGGSDEEGYPLPLETEPLLDLARQLAGDERMGNWVSHALGRRVDDPGYSTWLEVAAAQVAGALRLEPAVPRLMDLLRTCDDDLSHPAMESLIAIGGDVVVDSLDLKYAAAGQLFRERAIYVLENIHTARSAATLFHWLDTELNQELQVRILQALLAGFLPAAMERARQHLLAARQLDWDQRHLRIQVVAISTLTGCPLPELDPWQAPAREDFARRPWLSEEFEEEQEGSQQDEPRKPVAGLLGAGGPLPLPGSPLADILPDRVLRETSPRVSRNEPCPCGSGKKYKKCCMRKTE